MDKKTFVEAMSLLQEQYDNERASYEAGKSLFYKLNNDEGGDTVYPDYSFSHNLIESIDAVAKKVNDTSFIIDSFIVEEDCGRKTGRTAGDLWDKINAENYKERILSVVLHAGPGKFEFPQGFYDGFPVIENNNSARKSPFLVDYVESHKDECKDLFVVHIRTTSDNIKVIDCGDHEILAYIQRNRILTVDTRSIE